MSAAEKLVKLTAQSMPIRERVDGRGRPGLTGEDIAYALGTIREDGPSMLVRYMYAGEPTRKEVYTLLCKYVERHAQRVGWRDCDNTALHLLCDVTLTDYCEPPVCRRCQGTGTLFRYDQRPDQQRIKAPMACPRCQGHGTLSRPVYLIAEQMKIPWTTWRRNWLGRFLYARTQLQIWEDRALEAISRKID